MKFVTIAIILFLFQVVFGMVNALGSFSTVQIQQESDWLAASMQSQSYSPSSEQAASTNFGFGDFVKGFLYFVDVFAQSLISVGYTLSCLGVPAIFIPFVTYPVYLMYALGISQYIANRNLPLMK